ncbi:hypothetical protein NA57DRAFT_71223 [Rhizodiscina lignyota]|uniref:Uncharacterized protein n=1 Tax=Rhizodiscina lignyota TaxID=1504668 RepID=A0A9P4MF27_9PEZI|nr:hypothetical protein NA57DRAFT_71223 [Rhizodiscina lignyota]
MDSTREPPSGVQVLSLGLFRTGKSKVREAQFTLQFQVNTIQYTATLTSLPTGSASICEALTILGYRDVFHGIKAVDQPHVWPLLSAAADATFPSLPSYTGAEFGRADWDATFAPSEAITDLGSVFALQLIAAYPDAKVVLVERDDIDRWYRSMDDAVFRTLWGPRANFFVNILGPLFGLKAVATTRKLFYGFFEAQDVDGIRANAKERFRRHYREVRAAVPEEKRLDFRLQDGWEPLCRFLGKEVPNVPFPKVNETDAQKERIRKRMRTFLAKAARRVLLPSASVAVVLLSAVWAIRRGGGSAQEVWSKVVTSIPLSRLR